MPVTNFPDALSLLLELVALHKRSLSTDNDGTWTTPDEQVRETFPALMHRLEVEFDDAQTELFAARDYVEDLIVSVGAITKTTKALLDADLAHDDGVAALVLNDPVVDNNGLYQKEGASGAGSWVLLRSAPITTEQAARIAADAAIDARLTPVSARAKALPKNPRGYLHALVDPSGYVGWALMPDGRPVAALNVGDKSAASQARVLPLPNNPNGYAYVICDADGNVGMAILADGTLAQADGGEEQVSVEPEARPTAYVASGVLRYVDAYGDHATAAPADAVAPIGYAEHLEFASDYLSPGTLRKFRCRADAEASCLVPEPGGVVNGVALIGQSNVTGQYATAGLSVDNPHPTHSLMFNGGLAPYPRDNTSSPIDQPMTAFAPIAEVVQSFGGSYPPAGETCASGFARTMQRLVKDRVKTRHTLFVCNAGVPGKSYSQLKLGTQPFANLVAEVTSAKSICDAAGQLLVWRAVICIHGEADQANASYAANLAEWQADIESAIQGITGQTEPVHMLLMQHSAWNYQGSTAVAGSNLQSPWQQLAATESAPKLHLIGPGYPLAYPKTETPYSQGDFIGLHFDSESQRRIGAYAAKAYTRTVLDRVKFHCVRPLEATRAGAVIDVTFRVPVPPLVLDTSLVSDPGAYGFEYFDDSGAPPAIESVVVLDDETVRITLESDPGSATGKRVRYGFSSTPNAGGGTTTGPRGCLRDSDDMMADWDEAITLHNYCAHFDIATN